MFIGHFAVGFAAKHFAPRASLGVLLLAPLLLDALWPVFLALGLESVRIDPGNTVVTPLDLHDYPYTHSLVCAIGWSILAGGAYLFARQDRRAALVIAIGVFSHFVLDFVTHRPDMPLWPGSATHLGLGLWNSLVGTLVVEGALFVAGVVVYTRVTRAARPRGTVGFWALVATLVVFYVAAVFGPPPPSATWLMIAAFVGWLFVPWAWWIDRNRGPRASPLPPASNAR